jgi:hypothetical protein
MELEAGDLVTHQGEVYTVQYAYWDDGGSEELMVVVKRNGQTFTFPADTLHEPAKP